MITRRQWFMQLGGSVVLAGWSGADLDAAELPPGVYEASREHLGHALAGNPVGVGGQFLALVNRAYGSVHSRRKQTRRRESATSRRPDGQFHNARLRRTGVATCATFKCKYLSAQTMISGRVTHAHRESTCVHHPQRVRSSPD